MGIWPQFRSPLIWDVFAVSTYATVSLLFWYVGLIPDLATLRDRVAVARRPASSTACWRWAGAARRGTGTATRRRTCCSPAWRRRWWSRCTRSSASTSPSAIVPGWHTTIFPPYFVAGAIYSGFAMVLTLAIPLRAVYGLEDFITMRHLAEHGEGDARRPGLIVAYGYMMEAFIAWYSGNEYEELHDLEPHDRPVRADLLGADPLQRRHRRRCCGSSASARNVAAAVRHRRSIVNIGMWLERFVIIVTSLHRDFLPSSWGMYHADVLGLGDVHRHDRACS